MTLSNEAQEYLERVWGVDRISHLSLSAYLDILYNAAEGYELDEELSDAIIEYLSWGSETDYKPPI